MGGTRGVTIKNAVYKMIPLAPKLDDTAANLLEGPEGAFLVAPSPLQGDHLDGIEGGAGKPAVRIVSMTWSRSPCRPHGGDQAPGHGKPIMTIDEAARFLGVSQKRLANMISEEKARLGRLPDFVCNAESRMRRRILRDELLDWVRARRKRFGRPPKHM
jgi:hypothetical protein